MTDSTSDVATRLLGDYRAAMEAQASAENDVGYWTNQRAIAVARLHDLGWSLRQIAEAIHLSRPRAQQLVNRGRRSQAESRQRIKE